MVTHNSVGDDFDGEDCDQGDEAFTNPASAMFVALGGERVVAAEEGASNAAADAVVGSDFINFNYFPSCIGHRLLSF